MGACVGGRRDAADSGGVQPPPPRQPACWPLYTCAGHPGRLPTTSRLVFVPAAAGVAGGLPLPMALGAMQRRQQPGAAAHG
eukprot:COSAG01_NODE_649_length_14487_cov_12.974624_9_plen_81_part_00